MAPMSNRKGRGPTVHVITPANMPGLKLELARVFAAVVEALPPAAALDFTDWLLGQATSLGGRDRPAVPEPSRN